MSSETIPEPVEEAKTEPIPEIIPETKPGSRWQRFLHWEFFGLFIIVLATLIFHFAAIERPATIVWDEVYYVGDARSIFSGTGELRPEHPPLAKLFIVAGDYLFNGFKTPEHNIGATNLKNIYNSKTVNLIRVSDASKFKTGTTIRIDAEQMNVTAVDTSINQITIERGAGGSTVTGHNAQAAIYVFTDNAFDWRFFSIIIGTLGIIVFYFICRKLGFSVNTATLATFLFALDDMVFIHSGLALIDIYMLTFMLAAVLIYRKDKWKPLAALLVTSAVSFVVLLEYFDLFITRTIENPVTRITAMLEGLAGNVFTNPRLSISSRPWTWVYPQWFRAYYMGPNVPVILYASNPQYLSFISPTLQILIIPIIGYMIYKAIKKSKVAGFVLCWFLATYIIWIPLDIISNRTTFVFYFLSTTPAICIGIAIALSDWLNYLKKRRTEMNRLTPGAVLSYSVIGLYLCLHLAFFIVFNPAIPPIVKNWLPPFHIP
jgi:dolichyl-phosphate-mannose--protein O-mannosyl transferase